MGAQHRLGKIQQRGERDLRGPHGIAEAHVHLHRHHGSAQDGPQLDAHPGVFRP